jgi:hypothetical protein
MIFGKRQRRLPHPELINEQDRYRSVQEAIVGHARMVDLVMTKRAAMTISLMCRCRSAEVNTCWLCWIRTAYEDRVGPSRRKSDRTQSFSR